MPKNLLTIRKILTDIITTGTTEDEEHMYDANGPVWYRGWALDDEAKVCTDVEKVLAKTGTRRMIMGHTPDFTVRLVYLSLRPRIPETHGY